MELVDFLRQRVDEEEAAARASYDEAGDYRIIGSEATELHFMNWKPARVLAEAEAKRRLVELHDSDGAHECAGGGDGWGDATVWERICPTLRILALLYADHPDYDEGWRP